MGIKGFTQFLHEKKYPVEIMSKNDRFNWLNYIKNKNLYIDSSSFANYIRSMLSYNSIYYRYHGFRNTLIEFNDKCKEMNVSLIIVQDGIPCYSLEVWKERRKKDSLQLLKGIQTDKMYNLHIISASSIVYDVLDGIHIKAEFDADSKIKQLIMEDSNIGGLISSDSDFSLLQNNMYWFSFGNNGGMSIFQLPLDIPTKLHGLILSFGEHELINEENVLLVKYKWKSFQDILDKSTESDCLITYSIGGMKEQNIEDNLFVGKVIAHKYPSRVINIKRYKCDYIDNTYDHHDLLWNINVNKRFYGIISPESITLHTYIILSNEYTSMEIEPIVYPTKVDLFSLNDQSEEIFKWFFEDNNSIEWNMMDLPVIMWSLWKTKNHDSCSLIDLDSLLITMLICFYDIPWKVNTTKVLPKSYNIVYRWVKHVTFIFMLDKITKIWNQNDKQIYKFFDGDIYRSIVYKKEKKELSSYYFFCKNVNGINMYNKLK